VINSWTVDDRPPSRIDVARELVAVWAEHERRSYRLIKG
jgi:hypothetical protein